MKAFIKKIMICVYRILNVISPKSSNIIVFSSSNGKSAAGNPRAIYEYAVRSFGENEDPGSRSKPARQLRHGKAGKDQAGTKKKTKAYRFIWFLTDELLKKHPEEAGKLLNSVSVHGYTCRIVRYGHPAYYWYMARAGRWVFDSRQEPYIKKRPGVVYLQTWHGTPLKKLGLDIDGMNMAGENGSIGEYREAFRREAAQWDYLISQNGFSSQTFRRCFDYKGEMLEIGYPRNDVLVKARNAGRGTVPAEGSGSAASSGPAAGNEFTADSVPAAGNEFTADSVSAAGTGSISGSSRCTKQGAESRNGKKTLLYAPTWRDDRYLGGGWYAYSSPLDYEELYRRLGDSFRIIVKPHYLVKIKKGDIPAELIKNGFVKVCGQSEEINDLYLQSDGLITDYSSVMFDYSLLGRPMIFFAYDMKEYADVLRGFYFDFEAEAPGPICRTTEEVAEAVKEAFRPEETENAVKKVFAPSEAGAEVVSSTDAGRSWEERYGSRILKFTEKYNSFDDGNAAKKAWEAVSHAEG